MQKIFSTFPALHKERTQHAYVTGKINVRPASKKLGAEADSVHYMTHML